MAVAPTAAPVPDEVEPAVAAEAPAAVVESGAEQVLQLLRSGALEYRTASSLPPPPVPPPLPQGTGASRKRRRLAEAGDAPGGHPTIGPTREI